MSKFLNTIEYINNNEQEINLDYIVDSVMTSPYWVDFKIVCDSNDQTISFDKGQLSNVKSINWGDGNFDFNFSTTDDLSHTYISSGTYYISIKFKNPNGAIFVIAGLDLIKSCVVSNFIENLPKFANFTSLTRITIPNSVTSIANAAFWGCSSLTSIVIPDSVTSIGDMAFAGCTALTSIVIPNSVTSIGDMAFNICTSLTNIEISNSVTSIGFSAFDGCPIESATIPTIAIPAIPKTNLKTVVINGGTNIGDQAFYDCNSLTNITIPNSITSIGSSAFSGCSSLTNITISNNAMSIGDFVFNGCSSLTSIVIPDNVTIIGVSAFHNCTQLTSIEIPSSVTTVGDNAFSNCPIENVIAPMVVISAIPKTNLKTVVINGGERIESGAFSNCTSLTSVEIGNSIIWIGENVFRGCSSLEEIIIPFVGQRTGITNTSLYQYPFGYLFGTNSYTGGVATVQSYYGDSISYTTSDTYYIPSTLKKITIIGGYIPYGAFRNCISLEGVTIGDSVTSIGSFAFRDCDSLTSVTIPDSVTSIDSYAFENCRSLTSVNYTGTIDSWAEISFSGNDSNPLYYAKNLYIGGALVTEANITQATTISDCAFSGCHSLTSVTIGDGVTSIGKHAFAYCNSLTRITIPNSVTSIGSNAFGGCKALTSIVIPDSVTAISNNAFNGCIALTSVVMGNQVSNIDIGAFYDCTSLTNIEIPNSVKYISNYVFAGCSSLTSVTIPNSVTSIGENAFFDCTLLTDITIPDGVTYIGLYAFFGCTSLADITVDSDNPKYSSLDGNLYNKDQTTLIQYAVAKKAVSFIVPNKVTSITGGAFAGCTSLKSIEIPNRTTSIGMNAFYGCPIENATIPTSAISAIPKTNLKTVVINGGTSIGASAFNGSDKLTNITIPDSVTSIDNSAFNGCPIENATIPANATSFIPKTNLKTVVINRGIQTKIGDNTFNGCTTLTNVIIGNGITEIGSGAFLGCSSLTSVTIPDSVTSIGASAFEDCLSLRCIAIPSSVTSIGSQAFYNCKILICTISTYTSITWLNGATYKIIKLDNTQI